MKVMTRIMDSETSSKMQKRFRLGAQPQVLLILAESNYISAYMPRELEHQLSKIHHFSDYICRLYVATIFEEPGDKKYWLPKA
jgi:hypothetical protein